MGRAYWALTGIRGRRVSRLRTPLWGYFASVALFAVGSALFWAPMPAYLTAAGLATGAVFVLFLLSNVGATACFGYVDAVSARLGATGAQTAALAARGIIFPLVAVVGGWTAGFRAPVLGALFLAVGVTWAVVAVTATGLVSHLSAADDRAEALGLYTAVMGLGTGAGSIAGGALAARVGYRVAFGAAGVVILPGDGVLVADTRAERRSVAGAGDTET
jgi:MFS family permease